MKKIMIVEDNEELLELISSLLEQKQLLIYKSTGVQEALGLLDKTTVDAICSDYNLRDGTGLELFHMLHQQGVNVPFMIMSSGDDPRIINEVHRWGVSFCDKSSRLLIDKIAAL